MKTNRRLPGQVRDILMTYLDSHGESTIAELRSAYPDLPPSSIRSSLNLHDQFERLARGVYRLRKSGT